MKGKDPKRSPAPDSVMAAVDEGELVISDLERDGAWVSMDAGGACPVTEWA